MEKKLCKNKYMYYEWLQSQFHKKNTVFAKIWHYYLQPEAQKIIMKLNHYIPTVFHEVFFPDIKYNSTATTTIFFNFTIIR